MGGRSRAARSHREGDGRMYRVLTAAEARAIETARRRRAGRLARRRSCARAGARCRPRDRRAGARRARSSCSPGRATTAATAGSRPACCMPPDETCACSRSSQPSKLAGSRRRRPQRRIAAGVAWSVPRTPPSRRVAVEGVRASSMRLLGVGGSGALRKPLTAGSRPPTRSGAYLLSVDVPTGVDTDTGAVPGPAIASRPHGHLHRTQAGAASSTRRRLRRRHRRRRHRHRGRRRPASRRHPRSGPPRSTRHCSRCPRSTRTRTRAGACS